MAQAEQILSATTIRYEQIEANLSRALDLAANCAEAYRLASPKVRRQFNQALFQRLLIADDEVERAEYAEPFASLIAFDEARRQFSRAKNPEAFLGPMVRKSNFWWTREDTT
jgi:hypothetical protein